MPGDAGVRDADGDAMTVMRPLTLTYEDSAAGACPVVHDADLDGDGRLREREPGTQTISVADTTKPVLATCRPAVIWAATRSFRAALRG